MVSLTREGDLELREVAGLLQLLSAGGGAVRLWDVAVLLEDVWLCDQRPSLLLPLAACRHAVMHQVRALHHRPTSRRTEPCVSHDPQARRLRQDAASAASSMFATADSSSAGGLPLAAFAASLRRLGLDSGAAASLVSLCSWSNSQQVRCPPSQHSQTNH